MKKIYCELHLDFLNTLINNTDVKHEVITNTTTIRYLVLVTFHEEQDVKDFIEIKDTFKKQYNLKTSNNMYYNIHDKVETIFN